MDFITSAIGVLFFLFDWTDIIALLVVVIAIWAYATGEIDAKWLIAALLGALAGKAVTSGPKP